MYDYKRINLCKQNLQAAYGLLLHKSTLLVLFSLQLCASVSYLNKEAGL